MNGSVINAFNFQDLDGQTAGGLTLSVPMGGNGNDAGILVMHGQPIQEFAVGGQELWIDRICELKDDDHSMGGSTGGGVSSLSMIVRENGGEVSLSVNNVAPMYAANFAELDGQNIGGALVSITAAPNTPAGSNPGDNDVAFELHLGGPIEYVEIGGELVYIDHICLQYAGSHDGGTGGNGGTGGTGGDNGDTGGETEPVFDPDAAGLYPIDVTGSAGAEIKVPSG